MILRAWEDRALGFNNSLGGARVTFNIKDIVEGKVLYAFPRFNLGYLSTQIAGGDLSFSLSNAIGLLDHRLSLEGSIVNRHFKNLPSWYTEYRDDYDFDLSKNVISYSGVSITSTGTVGQIRVCRQKQGCLSGQYDR